MYSTSNGKDYVEVPCIPPLFQNNTFATDFDREIVKGQLLIRDALRDLVPYEQF